MALGDPSDLALASSVTSVIVGLIALAMAAMALVARRRSGNRQLLFVGLAFLVFAVKSAVSAADVASSAPHPIPHDQLELVLSLFDLAIITLLALPLVLKGRP